ncbi:MoaD/ThiS family protein [Senegalia massiliensis]|jgi:sulfur carrier protein|uniref:MoaD/ThiS family protein n=1 Tax=Senegalia massiliensis TaxID=1720316 RepID=UPI0010312376|nr:MoaD/ThiS family protein [Senegalia massiliensis]
MNIEVRLFATFREGRDKKYFLEIEEETTIKDIVKKLEINENEVSLGLLNGIDGSLDREVKNGDIISLFPPVGGG